jgi:hypothetical protein
MTINRSVFAREGVIYPAATGKNGGTQWGFVACAHTTPWKTDVGSCLEIQSLEDQAAYRKDLREKLAREFDAKPDANLLIISSEHMHSRLSNIEMIANLKEFLLSWVEKFEIVLYLRRQDQVALSLYSTKIKSGNHNPVLFPGGQKGPLPYYFDYEKIYANWVEVFGKEAIRVCLFDPREWHGGDLIEDFCMVCGLPNEGKRLPVMENESLNRVGAEFLKEVNRQLPNLTAGKRNKEREGLTQLVANLCRGKNYPAIREDAMRFYERFIEGNERLREKAFADRSAPLFDMDFSEYPEKLEQLEPRYEDAVALAIRIWRAKY